MAETYEGEGYCVKCKTKRPLNGEVHETNGRRIAKAWQTLFKNCEEDVQKQMARMDIQRAGGNIEQLQAQIQIGEKIIQWAKRCPPCTDGMGIPVDEVERVVKEWKRMLAEMRRNQNRGA